MIGAANFNINKSSLLEVNLIIGTTIRGNVPQYGAINPWCAHSNKTIYYLRHKLLACWRPRQVLAITASLPIGEEKENNK